MDPDCRLVWVGADQETHDDEPARRVRDRVDVLDVFDLVEQFFQRCHDPVFDLFGSCAGEPDHDVDHRDLDLGFLLRRRHDHREEAEQQRRDHDQRGQLRIEKGASDPSCNAELAAGHLEA